MTTNSFANVRIKSARAPDARGERRAAAKGYELARLTVVLQPDLWAGPLGPGRVATPM